MPSQFTRAERDYYDYDAYMRRQHDDENPMCRCADCEEAAEDLAADMAYERWKEDRYMDEQTEPDMEER